MYEDQLFTTNKEGRCGCGWGGDRRVERGQVGGWNCLSYGGLDTIFSIPIHSPPPPFP